MLGNRLPAIIALALVAGCSEGSSVPTAQPIDLSPRVIAQASDVRQSVTGHAEFTNPATGTFVEYSLSAIRHPNGRVTGEYQEHRVFLDGTQADIHGTVTCLTTVGNTARIGGTLDRVDPPLPPGFTEGILTVEDNGEGVNRPSDRASFATAFPPGTAQFHCATGLPRTLFPIARGNIQVSP